MGIYQLADEVLVVCPACGSRAAVVSIEDAAPRARHRLVCESCGLSRDRPYTRSVWGSAIDPWFECDLWLVASFREHTVWAYNRRHAELLREFVAATIRERSRSSTTSMIEKLPQWYKAAANRRPLIKILDDLIERSA